MEYKICTDKLPAAATVHACHYKGFSCSNYKANVNANIVYLLIPNVTDSIPYGRVCTSILCMIMFRMVIIRL